MLAVLAIYFVLFQRALRDDIARQLDADSEQKVRQIVLWRARHLQTIRKIAETPVLAQQAEALLRQPHSPAARIQFRDKLRIVLRSGGYAAVAIADPAKNILLEEPERDASVFSQWENHFPALAATEQVQLSNLQRENSAAPAHFVAIAAIPAAGEAPVVQDTPRGTLMAAIRADEFIQQLFLDELPLHGQTGEWQLAQREGDAVQFLTPSRLVAGGSVIENFPLNSDVAAARAIRGERGVVEAVDYRGVPILAALRDVPGTPWILVSKVDREEAYTGLQEKLWGSLALAALGMALLGLIAAYFFRTRRVHAAEQHADQLRRANQLYATLAQSNFDAIHSATRQELSERLCESLVANAGMRLAWVGWVDAESKLVVLEAASGQAKAYAEGLKISVDPALPIARGPAGRALTENQIQISQDLESDPTAQPWLERMKQWNLHACAAIPLEDAGGARGVLALYSDERNYFIPQVRILISRLARDYNHALELFATRDLISRQAKELKEDEQRLQLALSASQQGVYDLNLQTGVASVSLGYATMLGYDPADFREDRVTWQSRIHPEDAEAAAAALQDYLSGLRPDYRSEFRLRTKDGQWKWILSSGKIVERDAEGRPLRMIGTHTDVTLRRQSELELRFEARRTQALLDLPKLADDCDELTFLQRGLAMAEELTASCISFAHFVNPDQETIELAAWSKNTLEKYCHASFSRHYPLKEAGIWADAMRQRQAVVFNDYASYPHKHGLPQGHSPLVRLITVPVMEGDKFVMMAGVGNSASDYQERDVETLRLLTEAMWRTVQRRRSLAALQESEQRWQFALEGSGAGVWDWNLETNKVHYSDQLQHMLGYKPGKLRSEPGEWGNRIHPDDIGPVRRALSDYLEGRVSRYVSEHRLRQQSGEYIWVRGLGKVMERDANGKALRLIGTHTDITERRNAEEAVRQSEGKLSQLFQHLDAGVVVHGANTEILFVNPRASELLGISIEDLLDREASHPVWRFFHEDYTAMPQKDFPVSRVFSTKKPLRNYVVGVLRPSGTLTWVLVNAYPQFAADGEIAQVVVLIVDITERRRQEQFIREREVRWQETLLMAMDGYVELSAGGRLLEVNRAYEHISGYSAAELCERHVWEIEVDYDRAAFLRTVDQLRQNGSMRIRSRHRRKDGSVRLVEVSLTYSDRLGGRIGSFIRDITEQQAALEQLRVQSAALEAAANTIVITDVSGRIEWVNEAFTRSTGYSREEAVGQNPRVLKSSRHTPEFYAQMWQTILAGNVWQGELSNVRKDGSPLEEAAIITPVRASGGAITHFVAIKQDISERKRMEKQLLRSQRMEGIGLLASGIAHDLNNVLAPILLGVELMRQRHKEAADKRTIDLIESSARRGAGVVKQVLTFARGIDGERIPIRLRDLMREVATIIEETFPRNIHVRREVPAALPGVLGDVTQLHQVLLNLAVNARDAMPDGGTLTLRLEKVEVPSMTFVHSGELAPGSYAVLAVEDTGHGMTPELKQKIFEPFFTTKAQGKGTGLGLPTVLGIVRSHGGAIDLRSDPGRGSEFRIYLPALPADPSAIGEAVEEVALEAQGRTILVVDDEAGIREIAGLVLQQAGFTVINATDGQEALRLFHQDPAGIDAVLIDIMMPLMSGDRAAQEMWKVKPDLPVLFMSGLMEHDTVQASLKDVARQDITLVRKPFSGSDLIQNLARILGRRHP